MFLHILGVLLFAVSAIPDNCDTTIKGMVANKVTMFETEFNRLRNMVAQGRRPNHKGQIEYAANMHFVKWSTGIAKAAQNCAERCPDDLYSCRNLKGTYGALSKFRTVHSASIDYDAKEYFDKWMEKKETAEQLVVAHVQQFGCGRALKKNFDKYIEYVVCYFDLPPREGQAPYVPASEKTIGSACKLGRSSTYSGLCATSFGQMLLYRAIRHTDSKIIESQEQ